MDFRHKFSKQVLLLHEIWGETLKVFGNSTMKSPLETFVMANRTTRLYFNLVLKPKLFLSRTLFGVSFWQKLIE